jgi:hypothetical protein
MERRVRVTKCTCRKNRIARVMLDALWCVVRWRVPTKTQASSVIAHKNRKTKTHLISNGRGSTLKPARSQMGSNPARCVERRVQRRRPRPRVRLLRERVRGVLLWCVCIKCGVAGFHLVWPWPCDSPRCAPARRAPRPPGSAMA